MPGSIFLFNPTCEYAVANGSTSWQPRRVLQEMESDLSTLPMFFALPDDLILVDRLPSDGFMKHFEKIGVSVPQFVLKNKILNPGNHIKQTFDNLLPWGWSPAAHKLLSPLKPYCSEGFKNSPVASWKPGHSELYSKRFALKILKGLLSSVQAEIFISEDLMPEICTTREQIEKLVSRWGKLMVKAPWSSSGRGLQPVTKTPVHPKVWEKLLGIVNDQGFAMVEPFLDKVADLAFQFEVKNGGISFLGISNFWADKKGQYHGNFLNGLPCGYPEEVKSFLGNVPRVIMDPLIKVLEKSELAKFYEGNFGVDTLIFRDKRNQLKINPCLEINVRQNMGLLSLQLEKLLHPGAKGMFKIFYKPGGSFCTFKGEMEKKHPLKITSQKIESGFFPLTDATGHPQFGGYILV